MSKKTTIDLEDWYTNKEATERLTHNSGREIDKNYPRTLARYGKVRSVLVGARGKLYWKKDIDSYVVDTARGRKRKERTAPAQVLSS